MKRVLQFKKTDAGYACFENDENVFEIAKSNLQFDVKAFYQAFYSEDKDFEDIEVENCIPDDKDGKRVYDCIVLLMSKIKEKLAELPPEDSDESSSEDDDFAEDQLNYEMITEQKLITTGCGNYLHPVLFTIGT